MIHRQQYGIAALVAALALTPLVSEAQSTSTTTHPVRRGVTLTWVARGTFVRSRPSSVRSNTATGSF